MKERLCLPHALLLLALDGRKGICLVKDADVSLAAGVLGELLLEGRLEAVEDGVVIRHVTSDPIGDPVLDACLERITPGVSAGMESWLVALRTPRLYRQVAMSLCAKGMLREDRKRLFLIIPHTVYPEANGSAERSLRDHLHRCLAGKTEPDAATSVLISIAHRTRVLDAVFEHGFLEESSIRIQWIIKPKAELDAFKAELDAFSELANDRPEELHWIAAPGELEDDSSGSPADQPGQVEWSIAPGGPNDASLNVHRAQEKDPRYRGAMLAFHRASHLFSRTTT